MLHIPDDIERACLLGWKVFPASKSSRHSAFKGAHLAATDDLNQVETWCRQFNNPNWRVAFGPSKMWGLDVDAAGETHANDGVAAFDALVAVHGNLPQLPKERTGGGGFAIFFAYNGEPITGEGGRPAPGIDPRRGAQSQTIPPSRHIVTGKYYEWLTPPWEVTAPAAPAWLLRRVAPEPPQTIRAVPPMDDVERRSYAVSALRRAVQRVAATGEGNRNNALNREAWSLARFIKEGALTDSEIRESMYAAAKVCGLEARAALTTINGAIRSAAR